MRCVTWRPLARGSLQGFADIEMPSGLILIGCTLHRSNGKAWCSPPSRPQLDAERKPMLGDNGKILYAPIVEFADKRLRYKWSDLAVAAIEAFLDGKAPDGSGAMSGGSESSDGKSKEARRGS
ncbi:MAG TPA: hypothetical protein VF814_07735 [Casimicrobiaceae bacterium]